MRRSPRYGLAQFLAIGLALAASPAWAAEVTVCSQAGFERALDDALEQGGWIRLRCTTTNQLTSVKVIERDTVLEDATGQGWLVGISTNRLFEVRSGATLTLIDLRLVGGQAVGTNGLPGTNSNHAGPGEDAAGGAVLLHPGATLQASDVLFRSHRAQGGAGGAGENATTFSGEATDGGRGGHGRGGAIASFGGTVLLTNCVFESNSAIGGVGGAGGSSALFSGDGGGGGSGGEGSGGAIYSASNGVVRLVHCTFATNHVQGALGAEGGSGSGLIYFDGSYGASGSGQGGAVAIQTGSLSLENCLLEQNLALGAAGVPASVRAESVSDARGGTGQPGRGGALYVSGASLTLKTSEFTQNEGEGGLGGDGGQTAGGGDGGDGGAGGPGQGGAVWLGAGTSATIHDSALVDNRVLGAPGGFGSFGRTAVGLLGADGPPGQGQGGAIHLENGTLILERCLFEDNLAEGAEGNEGPAGTAFTPGYPGQNGGAALGGGLFHGRGSLTATNVTFQGNQCRGGVGGAGGEGSAAGLFATDGGDGGDGGAALGGGAWSQAAQTAWFVHCTFSDNETQGGVGGAGGPAVDPELARDGDSGSKGIAEGGALAGQEAGMTLYASLLNDSEGGDNAWGVVLDHGYNLSSDQSPDFSAVTSLNGVDPLLQALADHGGHTWTMSLANGSPALDQGPVAGAPPVDQRGYARDPYPDLGAFEVANGLPQVEVELDAGPQITLRWPAAGPDYVLESATVLDAPEDEWSPMSGAVLEGDSWVIHLDADAEQAYYRLRL